MKLIALTEIVMLDGNAIPVNIDGGILSETLELTTFYFDTPMDLTNADYVLFCDGTRVYID